MNSSVATQATALNDTGILAMNNNHYDAAIREFSRGLNMVKQVLAQHEDEDEMDTTEDDGNVAQDAGFYFAAQQAPVCKDNNSKGASFIFRSPIVVPSDSNEKAFTFQYYVRLSFVLLYNLALSHHMSALQDGNTSRRLQKALSLYELAYTIQMTEDISLSVMQTMAIVNNLGQIHTALGSEEKSLQCFQHLLSTIMFVNDCGEQETVQQLDGFLANVMPLILKSSSVAAAA